MSVTLKKGTACLTLGVAVVSVDMRESSGRIRLRGHAGHRVVRPYDAGRMLSRPRDRSPASGARTQVGRLFSS